MEKHKDNIYHVKYQKNLIDKVLNKKFNSIKDLNNLINRHEESKMKMREKDYVVYQEKLLTKVFDNLFKYLKSNFPEK